MESGLYLNKDMLPVPIGEYVLWCDGMGTGQELNRNLERSAVFVFKLHAAFLKASEGLLEVNFYPVMDGMYITCPHRKTIEDLVAEAFFLLAKDFITSHGTQNMFMVRGGIAFGPVIHGKDICDSAFGSIGVNNTVKNAILLSPAMVAANKVESKAPPFGIYVDDSAKTSPVLSNSSDKGFISSLYQWWSKERHSDKRYILENLYHNINHYFQKSKIHSIGMNYPIEKIVFHEKLLEEYLGGFSTNKKKVGNKQDRVPDK